MTLTPAVDRQTLENDWRAVEALSQPTFFQTWEWIGSFLETVPSDPVPQVLRVAADGLLVGICLLWSTSQRRRGFIRSRRLHLNETGDPRFDRVTIEHNGVLAVPSRAAEVTTAALRHLSTISGWDEIDLGGLRASDHAFWQDAASCFGLRYRTRWEKPSYRIDLDRVRESGHTYLDSLSANTRYQVRRAMRLYANRGPVRGEQATSIDEAIDWLQQLAKLHQAQWTARGHPGAFGSDFVVRFHERLVTRGWPAGHALLTRVSAGDLVLGYLYNFCRAGVVYNYQSGHIAEHDSKLKPGLVCHVLAVEDALQCQMRAYDLLMGGGHFKSTLTNGTETFYWATLQQRRVLLQLEDLVRRVRDRLRASSRGSVDQDKSLP